MAKDGSRRFVLARKILGKINFIFNGTIADGVYKILKFQVYR